MNEAVKFLKLLVLRICSLEVVKKAILNRIYECVFNSNQVLDGKICFMTLPVI